MRYRSHSSKIKSGARYAFQVLEVIRSNYDTLTLKLQENLDHYDKYAEKPREAAFFTQLVGLLEGSC